MDKVCKLCGNVNGRLLLHVEVRDSYYICTLCARPIARALQKHEEF